MRFSAAVLLPLLLGSASASRRFGHHVQNVLDDHAASHLLVSGGADDVEHLYTDAVVDHFDDGVLGGPEAKWRQRFYYDDSFCQQDGCPVFLYIGGEGPQGPPTSRLLMYTLAKENGALMVSLEHRFYGESYPTADMSNANLKYLTSEQALGDLARFIDYISGLSPGSSPLSDPALSVSHRASSTKWVAFGGSYPGNLATWLKLKYPASVVGSVGSSAPLAADYNFYRYAQVVGSALAMPLIGGSDQCYSSVEKAMEELHDVVKSTKPNGTSKDLPMALRPCTPINSDLDLYTYESNVYGNFQGTVQYNMQNTAATVADVCAEMTSDSHKTPLEALNSMVDKYFNTPQAAGEATCIASSWDEMLKSLREEKFDGQSAMRQWIYQSCNEFGYFQTTEGDAHPFTALTSASLLNAGERMCEDAYNIKDYKGPQTSGSGAYASDERYGARRVLGANITMPNGSADPWSSLGVVNETAAFYDETQELTDSEKIVFIDGTAHCRDMYAPGIFAANGFPDTGAVVWAHQQVNASVREYLGL